MRPQVISFTGVGSSEPILVDYTQQDFKIGFGVVIDGVVNYTVQHTFDDPRVGTPTYFDHETLIAQTADEDGNYAFPVRAVRITNNATTVGTSTMTLLQGH